MKKWYERIIDAHVAVTTAVSHSERLDSDRYFVWQEDGAGSVTANNSHVEDTVTGVTDFFTKKEFDPWAEALGKSFSSRGIAWSLVTVEYEPETGFYHYSWDWEV